MHEPAGPAEADREAFWRDFLTYGSPRERTLRRIFVRIPDGPRCQACAAPFGGVGAPVMRLLGKRRSERNPRLCNSCFEFMLERRGGAEIELSMLFADVRGSTTLAEHMSATAFHVLLERFYQVAARVVFAHDGSVDKFVGDELVAMYFPLAAGQEHARKAIESAQELLRVTGHEDPGGPWIPIGAGVHTGSAWVGALGDDEHVELTALGDAVNTAARLASVAGAGEILVSVTAAVAAGLADGRERVSLALKGKQLPTEVVRLGPRR